MKRHESTENYLETILVLTQQSGKVRSIDIANDMGFTKPSVSIAMKNLREKGCIIMDADGYITLTMQGERLAKCVYERHLVLTKALLAIGVSEQTAKEDACRVEHDISDETFTRIKAYLSEK
ncbi:MAG: metal-dependent transcriptional regulator [Angelakisella sp.]